MPSPVGHALAGATIAWAADLLDRDSGLVDRDSRLIDRDSGVRARRPDAPAPHAVSLWGLTLTCAAIAAAPDLDLLLRTHRTYTHSVGATMLVAIVAAAVAARARLPIARVALVCAAAHGSHILLDWLSADNFWPYGIQALWPFSPRFYISGLDVFSQTQRRHVFSAAAITTNAAAVARELLILGPPAVVVWLVRVKALAGLSTEMSGRDHPAK